MMIRQRVRLDRRTFLKASFTAGGGLLISSYLVGCANDAPTPPAPPTPTSIPIPATLTPTTLSLPSSTSQPIAAVPTSPPPASSFAPVPFEANMFIRIEPVGIVTLTVHRSEMGQGVRTALAMILAEELDADWATIRVVQAPAASEFGQQTTSGSGSIRDAYPVLRQAGAMARQILVEAASQLWGVAPNECMATEGIVTHRASGRQFGYGELAGAAKALKIAPPVPKLKDPQEFRLIGKGAPRIDGPSIVTGKAIYGLDVRLPGMLFAVVARCPVPGGKLVRYDDTKAKSVPGVRQIAALSNGVAVIAEHTWGAIQGRTALTVKWDEGEQAALSSKAIRKQLADLMNEAIVNETTTAESIIEAVYETPYLAHVPMEPMNCIADVRPDGCEIWAPTQNPQEVRDFVRLAVGVPTKVHVTMLGGGFGRRLEVDYAIEAAEVSKAIGAPVQVVWTREDDIRHDFYRPSTYHWLRVGLDATGKPSFWRHFIAAEGINGIAYKAGNDVLEEGLAIPYHIPNKDTRSLLADIAIPTGPWRGVLYATSAFANECFLDELAVAMKKDPLALRMELLTESDLVRPVLELAASKAKWGTSLPAGHGRGIACHTTYGQTAVAMVAEVSLIDHHVQVHNVICAIDCGTVIHPDMVAQQMEGAIADGITTLLKSEITFAGGRVQQGNFTDYPLLQIAEMPVVEVHILPSERPPQGVGEMGVPPIVPAVANAIYAASGIRIRRTPIGAGDV